VRLYADDGIRGVVIDLDTNLPVRKVVWLDVEEGLVHAEKVDAYGNNLLGPSGELLYYIAKGRFRFIPGPTLPKPQAPKPDPAELPEALRRIHKSFPVQHQVVSDTCAHYGCSRVATWSTCDEVDLPPEWHNGLLYARGKIVTNRRWCDKHYVPPRLVDVKGEIVQVWDSVKSRPQW
jgi:hypothetical protein